ncbi:MAG TPA: metal-dependent hydrolase [Steroidobacteraceae bacterium]
MDNLTHTLIGLIAGESVGRTTRAREPGLASETRRGLFVAIAAIGGNLPDLDLIYSYRGVPHDTAAKLNYVLEHRGYTHTVLGCLVLTLLLYAGAQAWLRYRRLTVTRRDRLELLGMSMFGTFQHLGMDFLNGYGVHPFWPLQNGWFYGDSVFIVEPLYWAADAPLIFVARSIVVRAIVGLALLAGLAAGLLLNVVPAIACSGYVVLTAVLLLIGWRASARTGAIASGVAMLLVTAVFILSGRFAAQHVDAIAATQFPAARVVDHVLTPGPMNPLCWDVLLLETHGERYSVRHGVLSNAPALIPASRCPTLSGNWSALVPVSRVSAPQTAGIHWLGEFGMSKADLAKIVAGNCNAAALMQFVRAPFVSAPAREWVIGDLRFAGQRGGGMADIDLHPDSPGPCLKRVPWTPPRADLLQ